MISSTEGEFVAPTIWLNVGDLLDHAEIEARVSGIQRLGYEICGALVACSTPQTPIGFVARQQNGAELEIVPWADVQAAHERLAAAPRRAPASAKPAYSPSSRSRKSARNAVYRLPVEIRQPLLAAYFEQRQAAGEVRAAASALSGHARRLMRARATKSAQRPRRELLADHAQPGDTIVTLGSQWDDPTYPLAVAAARKRGLRHALVIHDLIAVVRPEWCFPGLTQRFTDYMAKMLHESDAWLTLSRSNAADIRRFAAERGINPPCETAVLPIGSGFLPLARPSAAVASARIPAAGSFALCVSTIEARKNHTLLLHVWRRLLDDLGPARVPRLVLAGKVGWLVEDLMAQLRNCRFLDSHIVLFDQSDDAELEALYRGSLFTIYPSFYEGWGLPVTESLGFGRPCIAADSSSLPEAGGRFARYFPSGNATAAYRLIRETIENPDGLRRWADEIARDYRPVTWNETARALVAALGGARATA